MLPRAIGVPKAPLRCVAQFQRARPAAGYRWIHASVPKLEQNDVEKIKKETNGGEKDRLASATGVIDKTHQEVVLYYDHIYPWTILLLRWKNYVQWMMKPLRKYDDKAVKQRIFEVLGPMPDGLVNEFVPMRRDCGAFVKYEVPPNKRPNEFIRDIQDHVAQHKDEFERHWWRRAYNFVWNTFPTVYAVRGTPWIEDLQRFPLRILKVKFEGQALTEEEMYVLFRRYGPIQDIFPDASEARVKFNLVRLAICAKNCMTGITVDEGKTVLHLQYEPEKRKNYVTDFIANHQKISVPIIIALMAGLAAVLFDPIREFFIEANITKKYLISTYRDNPVVRLVTVPFEVARHWLFSSKDWVDAKLTLTKCDEKGDAEVALTETGTVLDLAMIWMERYEKAKELRLWIHENINTFIIVRGPKGSGKEDFVVEDAIRPDETLSQDMVMIDCDVFNKARNDNELMKVLALQIGYFPLFTWTNSVLQFIDLGVQGLTGAKLGLSELKETQFKGMFSLTTLAIRLIVGRRYQDYVLAVNRHNNRLGPDAEPVELAKEEQFLQQHPEIKPTVIIDKFVRRADHLGNDFIYPLIADWAATLIQNNLAHVVFTTNDVSLAQVLAEALPDTVFKTITLNDASLQVAENYLKLRLKPDAMDQSELTRCLEPLGGRMLDLQAFVRRNKLGESPTHALNEMITQAAEQITTFFLNKVNSQWNTAQIWVVMKQLAAHDLVAFVELLKDPVFAKQEETLATLAVLEKYDLITLERNMGVLDLIRMGRPLFKAAFKQLVASPLVFKIYETDYLKRLITIETSKVNLMEDELLKINKTKVDARKTYLANKIDASTARIEQLEADIKQIGVPKPEKRLLGITYG